MFQAKTFPLELPVTVQNFSLCIFSSKIGYLMDGNATGCIKY